jgi:hypothetical protein
MTTMWGAFGGSFVFWAINLAYYAAFRRVAFSDGQFASALIVMFPFGALLGGLVAICASNWARGERSSAAQIAVAGGSALLALTIAITLLSSDIASGQLSILLETITSGWLAPATACAAAFNRLGHRR